MRRVPPVLQAASLKQLDACLFRRKGELRSACIAGGLIEASRAARLEGEGRRVPPVLQAASLKLEYKGSGVTPLMERSACIAGGLIEALRILHEAGNPSADAFRLYCRRPH